jgi:AcrR family transcriptional regulator
VAGPESSLRERSKARRRDAIQRAAFRLFAERGYDGATIADIAEEAEVAPRTVSLYFPNKLDIALSTAGDIAARLTETFQNHPELAYTEVIDRWLIGESKALDPELAELTTAMFDANPQLRAIANSYLPESTQLSENGLRKQLGLTADDPMLAVASAAVAAVITEYLTTLLKSEVMQDQHRAVMQYLREIIRVARPAFNAG